MAEGIDVERYSGMMRLLHWGIAVLAFTQIFMGKFAEVEPTPSGEDYFGVHSGIGVLVLLLMALRIFWRLSRPGPAPFPLPAVQQKVMGIMHLAFYLLLILLPLSGWALASAGGHEVSLFGAVTLPPLPVTRSKEVAGSIEDVHEILGQVLLVLAVLHTLAALKHQFIDRDGLLRRMTPH
jgi:cytochrome b561